MKNAIKHAIRRFKSAPKAFKICTYLLVSYACYAAILGLVVPAVIESQAPKKLSEMLGRNVTLSEVIINPFTLRAELNQFKIAEPDGSTTFFGFNQLTTEVNFWQSVGALSPVVEYVTVDQLTTNIARIATTKQQTLFNFSDILQTLAQRSAQQQAELAAQQSDSTQPQVEVEEQQQTELFPLLVKRVALTDAQLTIDDKQTGVTLNYPKIEAELSQLDTQAYTLSLPVEGKPKTEPEANNTSQTPPLSKQANLYTIEVNGSDSSQLKLNGQFQLNQFELLGDISLSSLPLAQFWPLTENLIKAKLTNGQLDFSSQYHIKQDSKPVDGAFAVNTKAGQLSLSSLAMSYDQQDKVKLTKLALSNISLDTRLQKVLVDKLAVDGLWIDALLSSSGVDLPNYFIPQQASANANANVSIGEQTTIITQSEPSITPDSAVIQPQEQEQQKQALTQEAEQQAQQQKQPEQTAPQGDNWLVTVNQLAMQQTDIRIQDQLVSPGMAWRIFPLNLTTGTLYSDLSKPIDYQLDIDILSGFQTLPQEVTGQFSSQGSIDAVAQSINGEFNLTELQLKQFQKYVDPYANVLINDGRFSISGLVNADSKGAAKFDGQMAINSLEVNDLLANEPLLKWKNMSVDSIDFDQQAATLNIDTILLEQPYAKVIIAQDKRTNIGEAVKKDSSSAQSQEQTTAKTEPEKSADSTKPKETTKIAGLDIEIAAIDIVDGSAFFADYSLKPNFASGIEQLEGSIKDISSKADTRAMVDIKGKIDKYAPVILTGKVNPFIDPPFLDVDFSLDGAELTSVNPYSGTYAGYYIDKGVLSMEINYKLENNQLQGDNHVVIDQLTLGRRVESPLATSLPITLAIGLLKDSNGVIDLGFEVSGDINNPEFSFGSIIFKVITNLITKAITAPFSLLASLVESDDELDFVEFEFGDASIGSQAERRLAKLAEALGQRPSLNISVRGAVLEVDDAKALAELKLHNKLKSTSGLIALPTNLTASRAADNPQLAFAFERLAFTELNLNVNQERSKVEQLIIQRGEVDEAGAPNAQQVESELHIGLYNQLLSNQSIDESDLGLLAENRAKAVKAHLASLNISPNRVFILDSTHEIILDKSQAVLTIEAD